MRRLVWRAILGSFAVLSILGCAHHEFTPEAPPTSSADLAKQEKDYVDLIREGIAANPVSGVAAMGAYRGKFAQAPMFFWPSREPKLTAYFGWRKKGRRKKSGERMHEGIDLHAPMKTSVYASAPGKVIYASKKIRSYGKMVVVDHGHGWSTVYAHLNDYKTKVGDDLASGELLGLSGKTGRSTGPHLHFEIRIGSDPLDPLLFLPVPGRDQIQIQDEDDHE